MQIFRGRGTTHTPKLLQEMGKREGGVEERWGERDSERMAKPKSIYFKMAGLY